MRQSILVTGAQGQLGKTIAALFSNNAKGLVFTFASKEDLDICQADAVVNFFKKNTFDFCINCAAYTQVEQAEKTPEVAYAINSQAVKTLAHVCQTFGTTLVHISTDYVFDGTKSDPYTTTDMPHPINVYGRSKWQGEQHIQDIMTTFYIVRTSWLYSKTFGKNFYKTILQKAKTEKQLSVTDQELGCPTNTETLAKDIITLITSKAPFGIYHATDGVAMTWYDFAKKILAEHGLSDTVVLLKTKNFRSFAKRPQNSVLKKSAKLETNFKICQKK